MPTKNLILLSVLFTLLWNRLDAKIKFGPAVGFGRVLENTPVDDYGSFLDRFTLKTNMSVGVDLDFKIAGVFYISPSVLYNSKRARFSVDGFSSNYNQIPAGSFSSNYLEIPILFKVKLKNRVNMFIGPYIEHLLSTSVPIAIDTKDPFKDYDIGLKFGGGYDLKNGLGFNANISFDFSHYDMDFLVGETGNVFTWAGIGAHYLFGKRE